MLERFKTIVCGRSDYGIMYKSQFIRAFGTQLNIYSEGGMIIFSLIDEKIIPCLVDNIHDYQHIELLPLLDTLEEAMDALELLQNDQIYITEIYSSHRTCAKFLLEHLKN